MDILILLLVIAFLVLAPAIINKKIKKSFPIECPNCKYSGMAKYHTKGSFLTELILWCCLIIPGLIYSIWRLTTRKWVCPQCNYEYVIRLKN